MYNNGLMLVFSADPKPMVYESRACSKKLLIQVNLKPIMFYF